MPNGVRLQPGDPLEAIQAAEWNRHVDSSDAYHRTKALGEILPPPTSGGRDSNFVKVKNNSGGMRRTGEILEFTGLVFTDLTGAVPLPWMTGGSPTLVNSFGVLMRRMESGSDVIDDCQIAGVNYQTLVNVTDADHKYARVDAATYVLQSAAIGPARIIFKPTGTGEKLCVVLLNDTVGEVLIKNDTGSDIAVNSSGTFKIFTGTVGNESDTGQTISAYNKTSVAFKNGKFGSCSLLNGYAYAVPWQI